MAKTLVIVESPAKVKTISKFLGKQYRVVASIGHIKDLPKSQLGVDVENDFTPKYITIRGKGDIIKELRDAAKKADRILLATDPDREGEAIAWHLADILKVKEGEKCRITFNEITQTAVKTAISSARVLNADLIDAQQTRRILDRLVGYNLSPLLWHKVRRGLSAGRVQSSALKIVCSREREILAFVSEEYWTLDALLKNAKGSKVKSHLVLESNKTLKSDKEVKSIQKEVEKESFVVSSVQKKEKKRNPSPPFTTSTLQQEAFRKLGFSARKTMQVAQQLYEGVSFKDEGHLALITYMRTDSVRVSKDAQDAALAYIAQAFGKEYVPSTPRFYKGRSSSQDAHEAVRPVDIRKIPSEVAKALGRDQTRLYKLIWERFMASQMTSAVFDTVTYDIKAGKRVFRATGSTPKFLGYTTIYIEAKDDEKNDKEQSLPELKEGEVLKLVEMLPEQHFTQPPPRYTEATLVKALEENGIGRPSTYAPILEILRKRDYAEIVEKKFVPTETGFVVFDLLNEYFPTIVDLEFTAHLENNLDLVEEGKERWKAVIGEFYEPFAKQLEVADAQIEKIVIADEPIDELCPQCGTNLVIKNGRFGKFIACPNYPDCKYTKSITVQMEEPCPICGKLLLERKTRKGRKFYGCSGYPECEFTIWNAPSKVRCEKCGCITTERKLKTGTNYKCENPKCGHQWKATAGGKKGGK